MIKKPRLKTYLTVYPISETAWGLRGGPEELWRLKIDDPEAMQVFGRLLPLLNGQHTRMEITRAVSSGEITPESTEQMLVALEQAGMLEDVDPHGLARSETQRYSDQIAFFSRFTNTGGASYQARLKTRRVAVFGAGNLFDCVCNELREAGIGNVIPIHQSAGSISNDQRDADGTTTHQSYTSKEQFDLPWSDRELPHLLLCAESTYSPATLDFVDQYSKRYRVPWILVRATDVHEGYIGPLFVPGETASYASFEGRLLSNMQHPLEYQAFDDHVRNSRDSAASTGGLNSSHRLLSGAAVVEAIKFLTGALPPALAGRMLSVNFVTWETELHQVLSMPRLEEDAHVDQHYPWRDRSYAAEHRRS